MAKLKSNKALNSFWNRMDGMVDKMIKGVGSSGDVSSWHSGTNKLIDSVAKRDYESTNGMLKQLRRGARKSGKKFNF
jgi:hypothetical protein